MKSKKLLNVNNQRIKNRSLQSSVKQWVSIVQGINKIDKKIKQLSQKQKHQHCSQDCSGCMCCECRSSIIYQKSSKARSRVQTSCQSCKSVSRLQKSKRQSKLYGSQSRNIPCNTSQRTLHKTLCNRPTSKKKQRDLKINRANNTFKSCHFALQKQLSQNQRLRNMNQILQIKNSQLTKKIDQRIKEQKQQQTIKQKIQKYKTNQIVLQIIDQNQDKLLNSIKSDNPHQIFVQLRPKTSITLKIQKNAGINHQINQDLMKKEKEKHFKTCKQQKQQNQWLESSTVQGKEKSKNSSRCSQIKGLETEFDRLMGISYLQKNKSKKRQIWGQMKSIASQLKLMRCFTLNN